MTFAKTVFAALAALLVTPALGWAQDTAEAPAPVTQAVAQLPTAPAADSANEVGQIVITGSRVMNGNASTVPTTVDTEAYLNVQDVFNSQPGLAGRNTASGIGEQGGYVPGDDVLGRVWTVGFRIRH